MTILTGDDRYYNNILTSNNEIKQHKEPRTDKIHNGLDAYDEYPLTSDYWYMERDLMISQIIKFPYTSIQIFILIKPSLLIER